MAARGEIAKLKRLARWANPNTRAKERAFARLWRRTRTLLTIIFILLVIALLLHDLG